jgi:hypothetical protein
MLSTTSNSQQIAPAARHWTWGPFASPAAQRDANRRYAAVDG